MDKINVMGTSLLKTLQKDFVRGLGRQAGFRTWKTIEKEAAKKVIDPNSKFRKVIQKFELPGNPKSAIQKLWTLIDLYAEEYKGNKSLFQESYKERDINFINRKFDRVEQMQLDEEQLDNIQYLREIWNAGNL